MLHAYQVGTQFCKAQLTLPALPTPERAPGKFWSPTSLIDPAGRPLSIPCQSNPASPPLPPTTLPGGGQALPLPAQAVLQTYM